MPDNFRDHSLKTNFRSTEGPGGFHLPHVVSAGYDPADDMMKIKSMQKKFRDSFSGAAVDTTKWDLTTGPGATVTVSGGTLQIAAGTTINSVTELLSKETFTIPARMSFCLGMTGRIANNQTEVGLLSVDPVTGLPDGLNEITWVFTPTSAVLAQYRVRNSGHTPLASAGVTIGTTVGAVTVYEIEPFADEAWFHTGVMDANAGRAVSYRRHQNIPDPNAIYKAFIRTVNGATAPASSIVNTFQFVAVQDYAELTAEITAGRGQAVAGQAIGVAVTSSVAVGIAGNVSNVPAGSGHLVYADTVTALAAGATFTGTSRDITAAPTYQRMVAQAFANVAGTLFIERSADGTTWFPAAQRDVLANIPAEAECFITARFYRVRFLNGAAAQTSFSLTSAVLRN